ncbi:uncharacterized protein LOC135075365 [Ostrinia nubilalis]|uniref:uncharacterized protein LOC135075365 n=1 Tax=Ostrinia nubilalis TaxID=29057 RepID=UPI0030825086
MISPKLFTIYLIYSLFKYSNAASDEIILGDDKPYEVIEFKVPAALWKEALKPTPVLKSPVTVVVPVHVPPENNVDNDDYIADEPETEAVTELAGVVSSTSSHVDDPVVQQGAIATEAAPLVTQASVVQSEATTAAPQQVTGSLIRFPCSCVQGQCGCCTGAILQRFRTKACGNITFIPEDFIFDVRMTLNDNTVVRRRVSASDPPPICFNPRRAPFVNVCAEISNIRIRNRNAFACLDINADIGGFPVYTASFRCFGLGASGVQTGLKPKPVSSGPAPVNLFGNNDDDDDDDDGFLGNAAGAVLGDGPGIFGGGDDDDGGPLDAIGDAVGDIFDGRKLN